MVQVPARSLGAAMASGPRYLLSSWPWRALLWTMSGAALSVVVVVAAPLTILGAGSRSLRNAVWAPLLELECARLSLIDGTAAERVRHDVATARAEQRVPSLRQLGYVLFTALVTGSWGAVLVAFMAILIGVMVAAPWLVRPGEPINVALWLIDTTGEAWVATLTGLGLLVLTAYLVGAYAAALGQLAVIAMTDPQALQREVTRLEQSRTALLDAVEQERRRIESELHDRVQHRLVTLALTLGIAESVHGDDETGRLAAEAHRQLDATLAELRAVLLGILPRALTEHGLEAAVTDLIGAYPLPVSTDFGATERNGRLPAVIEHTAYLVINEALSNVVKHSSASAVTITADRQDDRWWWLTIRDDGRGGAAVHPGRGLATLAARVEAVNGALSISSPDGGPTEMSMRCPI